MEESCATQGKAPLEAEGMYVYCVANSGLALDFGAIGIGDSPVYTLPYQDISAVVHDSPLKPPTSKDPEFVKRWLLTHTYVLDRATERFGTVLPVALNTIVKAGEEAVRGWLSSEYAQLKGSLERLKDKAEYTIQIFCDEEALTQEITEKGEELRVLKEKMTDKGAGAAYLYKRKLDLKAKEDVERAVRGYREKFLEEMKGYVEATKVERETRSPLEEWRGKGRMILNLSCLVGHGKIEALGEVLDKINRPNGLSIRFTGPWPPFSFSKLREGLV